MDGMGNAQDAQDAYCRLPPEKLPFKMSLVHFSKHHCVAGQLCHVVNTDLPWKSCFHASIFQEMAGCSFWVMIFTTTNGETRETTNRTPKRWWKLKDFQGHLLFWTIHRFFEVTCVRTRRCHLGPPDNIPIKHVP